MGAGQTWFADATSVVLVRDLLGRVRLVVDGPIADGTDGKRFTRPLKVGPGGIVETPPRR